MKERIKELCKSKGVSMNQAESEIGLAKGYISKLDKSNPNIKTLRKIADYFGVSVEYLSKGGEFDSTQRYYLNDETAAMAQEIFENRDLRLLFDAARDADPESLKALHTMALALKRKEGGMDDDAGC